MYTFSFYPYQYPFKTPLQTHHGTWEQREGIIVNLTDTTGNTGKGEIAPLPWFGSESFSTALQFCQQLDHKIFPDTIFNLPDSLPACQFALESALADLTATSSPSPPPSQLSHLLPTGETCLHHWQTPYQQGIRTFKVKIAVSPLRQELSIIQQLLNLLPPDCKLRLDANGGLTPDTAQQWLQRLDHYSKLEFLEQPLPPQDWTTLCKLSQTYQTPLALDESVATLSQLQACYHGGWDGIFVIKAAIAGSPRKLTQFCQTHPLDLVFSSVFETPIGMQAAFRLAQNLASPHRALGYSLSHWINSL